MEDNVVYDVNKVTLLMKRCIYDKEAILAAAYLLTGQFFINIDSTETCYKIVIEPKEGNNVNDIIVKSFINNCQDEQLKLVLEKRTGKIRELIVQHAFSPINLQKEIDEDHDAI